MSGKGSRSRTPEILILISSAAAFVLTVVACLCADEVGRAGTAVMAISALACALVSANMMVHAGGSAAGGLLVTVLLICMLAFAFSYILYYLFTRPGEEAIPAVEESQVAEDAVPADAQREQESSSLDTREEESASPATEESTEETVTSQETLLHDMDGEDIHVLAESGETDTLPGYGEDTQETSGQEPRDGLCEEAVPPTTSEDDGQSGAIVADVPDAPSGLFATTMVEGEEDEEQPTALEEDDVEDFGIYVDPYADDDFWASFYIAGQDELVLEDGIYYMSLYINDVNTGVISTLMEGGIASLSTSELSDYTYGTLTDEARSRVFDNRGSYITLDELEKIGVDTRLDNSAYEVYLFFDPQDMPIQIISIRGSSRTAVNRPISGGIEVDPSFFTLISRHSLSMGFDDLRRDDVMSGFWGYFSSSSSGRIHNVDFDFSFGFRFTADSFDFSNFSYSFHRDFPDAMIRLQWGMVGTSLLSPSGTGLGIRFDKSLAYSNDRTSNRSHTEQLVVVDKTSDVEVFNEGRSIFKRTLAPGMYRLQDFVLYSGANRILIRISPLDGSPVREIEFDVLYSSSLLAPGEAYYGAALAFSRSLMDRRIEKAKGAFSLPLWGGRRIDYDFSDIVLSAYVRAGLTERTTMNATIALQNKPTELSLWGPNASLAMEFTNVNILGNSRLSMTVSEHSDENGDFTLPTLSASLGHQVSTDLGWLSSLSFGASWTNPADWDFDNSNFLSLNAGIGGGFGFLGWSLSAFGGFDISDPTIWSWSTSASVSVNLGRHVYVSGSLNASGTNEIGPEISGRVSASLRFGGVSTSASTDFENVSLRFSAGGGRHSLSGSINGSDILDVDTWNANASYSYGGRRIAAGINMNSSRLFESVGLSANLSTSTVFADGLFAIASSIPTNFLLVSQKGALKGNDLSVGTPGTSSFAEMPTTFGTALYTGLPSYGNTSLMVYSSGSDQFSTTQSLAVNLIASDMKGYVLRMDAEDSFSASGMVYLPDGNLWLNGASPLYSIEIDDAGNVTTIVSDSYIFSDSDGRFVVSQLPAGAYGFDVPYEGGWVLYIFQVSDSSDAYSMLQMMGDPKPGDESLTLPEPYLESYVYELDEIISSQQFFELLYPEAMEVAV